MKKFLVVLMCLGLVGCATTQNITLLGNSLAQYDPKLKRSIFNLFPAYASAMTGCKEQIDSIYSEVIQRPDNLVSDEKGRLNQGEFKERWKVTMCGKTVNIIVTIRPMGVEGSLISLSKE